MINNSEITALQNTIYTSRNPMRRWLHTTRRSHVISAIKSFEGSDYKTAIEVGPGSGVYMETLCTSFSQVTAVDIEKSHLVELLPLKNVFSNLELLEADITSWESAEQYDLVLCSEVLEHTENISLFIASLGKITSPGGTLVLSTPQPFSFMELVCKVGLSPLFINLTRVIYREPVLATGHINLVSENKLVGELTANGYIVNEIIKFGLYIPVVGEFGGLNAVKFAEYLEKILKKMGVTWPLWTQLLICKKTD